MTTGRLQKVGVAAVALGALLAPAALAEDERGRWSFSFGPGVHSTFDDIRNNAAVAITREAGATSNDTSSDGDLSNDEVVASDPRTDDLLARQTKVEEKQRLDFSVAYGLTSWLSLQFDTGYYRGDVAPLDTLITTPRWVQVGAEPTQWSTSLEAVSTPITVGELTQIPVSINAVARFRKDSPFNPFMGIGVGYMFNDLEEAQSFRDLNQRILTGFHRVLYSPPEDSDQFVNTQEIYHGFLTPENQNAPAIARPVYTQDCTEAAGDPETAPRADLGLLCSSLDPFQARYQALPTEPFVRARVGDAFLYQFSVGADYHFNENWSAYVAARYVVTDAQVEVKIEGVDPADGFFSIDEGTFRFIADTNPLPPPEGQSENRFYRLGPTPQGFCDSAVCRTSTLYENILVQGGEIDLTAFTVGAGIQFTF
jgi:outer membrane protein W